MLFPIRRILWPTDFSEASYEALDRALELCAHHSSELVAVHVVPDIPRIMPAPESGGQKTLYPAELKAYERELHKAARQRLHEVIEQRAPKNIKSAVVVTHGDPACEILRTAEDERVSLIVISTHGLTGWRQLVFGSVAERVVRVATCPVLTIRSPREKR
jgi:nucleotide-binding universal stress UspA family protein